MRRPPLIGAGAGTATEAEAGAGGAGSFAVTRLVHDATARLRCAAALDADGRAVDLRVDRLDRPTLEDGIFLARVEQFLKNRNAALVSLGPYGRGMLAAADARPVPSAERPLGAILRAGQLIIVQVKADAVGDKAAVVTMDVVLTGRLLACAPLGRGVAVSRRLAAAAAARQALRDGLARRAPREVGWIIRAAAAGAAAAGVAEAGVAEAALDAEAARLLTLWRDVAAAAGRGGEPGLLRPPPDALERLQTAYDAPTAPPHAPPAPAPPGFDFAALLAALTRPHVALPNGGRLIIEPTAALTAVDVDGGAGDALSVNLAAADELARQLRLRNLGGVVMADFIRLKARGDQEKLLARLRADADRCLRIDEAGAGGADAGAARPRLGGDFGGFGRMTIMATERECPICGRPAAAETAPFCSKRCADVDLARWLGEVYRAPARDDDDAGLDDRGA